MSEGNGYASRESLLSPAKRRFKDVLLPVSRKKVRIRSLFEGEKEAYEAEMLDKKGSGLRKDKLLNARRRLIVLCLVDKDGTPILSNADLDALRNLDGADMATLQEECQSHCGFKQGDIEGLVGNSDGVHVSDS